MIVVNEFYPERAHLDCVQAEERSSGIGSQATITHHYFCKKKSIPITEPIENMFITVPMKPIKQIGSEYHESGWWLWKEKATIPIFEYQHPCEGCKSYEVKNDAFV